MRIFVKVKAGKWDTKVARIDNLHFTVEVKARAEKGQANAAVVSALADYFHVAKSRVTILSGNSSKTKIIAINK